MLDEESTVISLLTQSSDGEQPIDDERTSREPTQFSRNLKARSSETSTSSEPVESLFRLSCSQKAFEYMMSLPFTNSLKYLLDAAELGLFDKLYTIYSEYPSCARLVGTLLGRKWPKWHSLVLADSDERMLSDLIRAGIVIDSDVFPSHTAGVCSPSLIFDPVLTKDLSIFRSSTILETFLFSLPTESLKRLCSSQQSSAPSRSSLISRIITTYNGKQRNIFGGVNDVGLLIKKVHRFREGIRYVLLTESCRRLFNCLSFALDLDCDDENGWDNALPSTIQKAVANIGLTSLTPRKMCDRGQLDFEDPGQLRVFQSRIQLEQTRLIEFLEVGVTKRRLCPRTVAANVRLFIASLDLYWNPGSDKPEWWWRRQLPRRCSNLIWKCVAELERLKYYEVAFDHLNFLLDHWESLLGKKRRGKVAIRLLIECGHLGKDITSYREKLLAIDLYPADMAEIERKISGLSLRKFEWPCGAVSERTIEVFGASTRDFNWVENAALEEYYLNIHGGGYEHGVHCEGRVMMDIFNVFFAKVLGPSNRPGVFQSPIQRWSLDVGYLDRDPGRWGEAMEILSKIAGVDYEDLAELYATEANSSRLSEYPASAILTCMQGRCLAEIMKLIVADPFYWGGGQPDLLAWDTRNKRIIFAEVKGPGDQLSPRQRWWLSHLQTFGLAAEVCYVIDERVKKSPNNAKKVKKKHQESTCTVETGLIVLD
jgi:hypothetical protein